MFSLLKDAKISRVVNGAAAGTSDQTSAAALDMTGFDSVLFFACLGDVTNTSVLTLTAYSVATNAVTGGASEGATAAFTADATSADQAIIAVEVHRPANRYVYCTLNRATANAVLDGIFAIQFNSKAMPVTQAAGLIASKFAGPNA